MKTNAFGVLALLAGAGLQVRAQVSGTICHQQDDLFARHFDIAAVVVALGGCLILPAVLSYLRPLHWWLTGPFRRCFVFSMVALLLAAVLLIGLPALAVQGLVDPAMGLLAYPIVATEYALECPSVSFQSAGVLFGCLGLPRQAAIAQPGMMALALVIVATLSVLAFYLFVRLTRRRSGVSAAR